MIRSKTLRTQRIERRLARSRAHGGLNIVSLMDIFTILVFYLLVNSAQVEVLPNPRSLALPESVAAQGPRLNVLLMVTQSEILVENEPVMSLADAANTTGNLLAPLKYRLQREALLPVRGRADVAMSRGEINIMADKDIPYQLIKKVMATCTESRFDKISLAVIHREGASK